uniref:ZP domain-containing protein n=1 Tax=Rhabditophanes sp. KR3021 TaxID=114890 RepID=A0AC35U864_9BILA
MFLNPLHSSFYTIKNDGQGEPEINCGHGQISFNVKTQNGPPSTIFVKGNSEKEECSFKETVNATISLDKCNMRRKREVNPDGVAYSMTIIVQNHPLFITKLDRAYNVHCFYMEANKDVNTEIDVSDLNTEALDFESKVPTCTYTIRTGSQNGPKAQFANVGDNLFHVWDCPSDTHAMLIHSCDILDGQGNKQNLIDENGCAMDDFLMQQLTYTEDRTKSFTPSNAFNFPDKISVFFNCKIRLCYRSDDGCKELSPPKCNGERRKLIKENIEEDLNNDQLMGTSTKSFETTSSATTKAATTTATTTIKASGTTKAAVTLPFPTPAKLEIESDIEGSGIEISERESLIKTTVIYKTATTTIPSTTTSKSAETTTTTLNVFKNRGANRSQRHTATDNKRHVDFDITSSDITIMDEYFATPEKAPRAEATFKYADELTSAKPENNICIPAYSIIIAIGVLIILFSALIFVMANFRKNWTKFY